MFVQRHAIICSYGHPHNHNLCCTELKTGRFLLHFSGLFDIGRDRMRRDNQNAATKVGFCVDDMTALF